MIYRYKCYFFDKNKEFFLEIYVGYVKDLMMSMLTERGCVGEYIRGLVECISFGVHNKVRLFCIKVVVIYAYRG